MGVAEQSIDADMRYATSGQLTPPNGHREKRQELAAGSSTRSALRDLPWGR